MTIWAIPHQGQGSKVDGKVTSSWRSLAGHIFSPVQDNLESCIPLGLVLPFSPHLQKLLKQDLGPPDGAF